MPRLSRGRAVPHLAVAALLTLSVGLATGPAGSAGAAGAAPAAPAAAGATMSVPTGAKLTLAGHGYGHGRGMSQYGAEGAARKGLTAPQILAFYYPGTTLGAVGGRLRVLIGSDTTADTVALARPGLVVRTSSGSSVWNVTAKRPGATQWRLNPLTPTRTAIASRTGAGPWKRLASSTSTLEFWAGGKPITLVGPAGRASYRGALRNAPYRGRDHDTVNVLTLDSYLRGVVASEMPASWRPSALQAQAVAARTYAAYGRAHTPAGRAYDICDSTSCQVYRGVAGETAATDAAIAATAKRTLLYGGQPAFTQFSSSSGGWTVAGTVAYQKALADPYDNWAGNGQHDWSVTVKPASVARAWPRIGTLTGIQVLGRDGNGDWGGRVTSLRLSGTADSMVVSGDAFRSVLGLKSTYFNVAVG